MQHSSVPAPLTTPSQPQRKLAPVEQPRPRRVKRSWWLWIALAAVGTALGAWMWQRHLAQDALAKKAAVAGIRTAKVGSGSVVHTIRLTGVTAPAKYVTILGPQLRGSRSFSGGRGAFMGRSGGGGGGGGSSGGGGGSSSDSSSRSGSSSSGSGSSSLASTGSTALGGSGSSLSAGGSAAGRTGSGIGGAAIGGVRSSSSAFRAATTRERGSSRSSGGAGGSASSAAAAVSAALGSEGLGSTSSSLFSGGGGGGPSSGAGDFGAVLQYLIKPGAIVKKGDKLAEFDRQYMLQRLDDYRAGVVQQELNLKKLLANIEVSRKAHDQSILVAKSELEKAKLDLKTAPVRSEIETERFKLALEEAEARYQQLLKEVPFVRDGEQAQIRISQLDYQQSETELRRSERNAERMLVRAPIEGMVVMLNILRGAEFGQVQEGDPIPPGMPFMRIVDMSSMVVEAVVNQVDVEKLRVGAKARVRFDAFPDLELPGKVYSVAAMPRSSYRSNANYIKEIPVRISLDKMDPRVIPDLSVSVDVVIEETEAPAVAPLHAVFRDAAEAKPYVLVKKGDGWERRTVETGVANNTVIAILSGLKPGEIVAEEKPPLPVRGGRGAPSS